MSIQFTQLKADEVLAQLLNDHNIGIQVFTERERPTSDLPEHFIQIFQNGNYRNRVLDWSIIDCSLIVEINTLLLSNQGVNKAKENIIVGKIQELLQYVTSIIVDETESTIKYLYFDGKKLCINGVPLAMEGYGDKNKYEVVFSPSDSTIGKSRYLQSKYGQYIININAKIIKK